MVFFKILILGLNNHICLLTFNLNVLKRQITSYLICPVPEHVKTVVSGLQVSLRKTRPDALGNVVAGDGKKL